MQLMAKVLDDVFEAQPLSKSASDVKIEQDRCYISVIFNYRFPIMNDFDDESVAGKEFAIEMTVGIPHYGISVLWLKGVTSLLITRYNTEVESMKVLNNDEVSIDEYTLCREFLSYLDKCGATIDIKEQKESDMLMTKLMSNGDNVQLDYYGISPDEEVTYRFKYNSKVEWGEWPMPDGTTGPLTFDITFTCMWIVSPEYEYCGAKVDKLKLNKIICKNSEHQAYFDEHLKEFELALYDEFNEDEQLIDEFFTDIYFER